MMIWLGVQLPPSMATWMCDELALDVRTLKELGLRDAKDRDIFTAARNAAAVLISKDVDFVGLVQRYGVPPQLVWLTLGNVTNARLQVVISAAWPKVATLLQADETIVELCD